MHGILKSHHAGLHVQSAPGAGATFKILFPATRDVITLVLEGDSGPKRLFEGRVLVADDEPMVLDFAAQALTSLGFHVTLARDGAEAVDLFVANPDWFRLVILDITMPRMDGLEAFAEVKRLRPAIPVILSSGYHPASAAQDLLDQGRAWFLPKPYPLRELRKVVLQAMAKAGHEGIKPPAPPTLGA
jgi:CheY-like chemotaxis protein